VSVILSRRESATVMAGLRLLAGDGVQGPNYPHVLVAGLCDETDPEYDLRFDADEEYVRELIDRIDEVSLSRSGAVRPVLAKATRGSGKGNLAGHSARTASGMLRDILFCRRVRSWRGGRAAVVSRWRNDRAQWAACARRERNRPPRRRATGT
jgi:hypothetical protein